MTLRLLRFALWIPLAFASPLLAHVVSMSTGDLTLNGSEAIYELRMPLYEAQHVANPQDVLLGALHFRGGILMSEAKLLSKSCREADGQLICAGIYLFQAPPAVIEVECTLAKVTVPNHVHLLRAKRGDREDQAVFDLSFQKAELRFEPPSPAEKRIRAGLAGLWRAIAGPAQWLFLIALVIASRSARELLLLAGMFILGELAAQFIPIGTLPPRFLEAAAALTVAYLAVEVLWLDSAGARWAVLAVLGAIHGLYFAQFANAFVEARPALLAGVVVGEIGALAILALAVHLMPSSLTRKLRHPAAWILFAVGLGWFATRLIS